MSDVGGVLVDKDAVYIDVKTANFNRDEDGEDEDPDRRGLGEQLVVGLQGERKLLGEADSGVRLFRGGGAINKADDEDEETGRTKRRSIKALEGEEDGQGLSGDDDEGFESGEDEEEEEEEEEEEDGDDNRIDDDDDEEVDVSAPADFETSFKEKQNGNARLEEGDLAFADSDSDLGSISSAEDQVLDDDEDDDDDDDDKDDMEEEEESAVRWKENMLANAQSLHGKPKFRVTDLSRILYDDAVAPAEVIKRWSGKEESDEDDEDQEDGEDDFFKKTDAEKEELADNRAIPEFDYEQLEKKWQEEERLEALRNRFVTGKLSRGDDDEDEDDDDVDDAFDEDEDDEGDGEFEDLETGETFGKEEGEEESEAEEKEEGPVDLDAERERNAKKKEELRLRFEEEDREGFGLGLF